MGRLQNIADLPMLKVFIPSLLAGTFLLSEIRLPGAGEHDNGEKGVWGGKGVGIGEKNGRRQGHCLGFI